MADTCRSSDTSGDTWLAAAWRFAAIHPRRVAGSNHELETSASIRQASRKPNVARFYRGNGGTTVEASRFEFGAGERRLIVRGKRFQFERGSLGHVRFLTDVKNVTRMQSELCHGPLIIPPRARGAGKFHSADGKSRATPVSFNIRSRGEDTCGRSFKND